MQHPIELVVFDLAGTTIDDAGGAVLRCLVEVAEEHQLPADSTELNALMGMNKIEVFDLLARRALSTDAVQAHDLAERALERFYANISAYYEAHLQPIDHAEDTFRFLRQRGIKVAIDTGFDKRIAGFIVDRLDWPSRLVDVVVSSSEVRRGRPAPYMIFHAMEQLGVIDVQRVMKIGDSPADLEEGANAGCSEVVGVLSGAHTRATLSAYPDVRIIESVADLPELFG